MSSSSSSSLLLEKRYDAFLRDGKFVRNSFNSTFLSGQLLRTGYEQEIIYGHYLRDMYIIRSLDGIDERMRLYDPPSSMGDSNNVHDNECVKDQQRTLSSGEAVIKGIFGDLLLPSPRGGGGGL